MTDTATAVPPQRGDETALYLQYSGPLRRAVRRAVNASDATIEDACQFAWTQLLRRQPARPHVFGWLRTTAVREAWALSAGETRCTSLDITIGEREESTSVVEAVAGTDIELTLDARNVLRAIARLRPKHRYAISRLAAGLSYEEIQAESGLSYTQVNRHLARARAALRA
jgi:DNA-directed RNA polymerase specialized sigma24 family protein